MKERKERSYATNLVSKNDLYMARPDLRAEIENLDEADMQSIAKDIGDAVAETHDIAIDDILAAYLGVLETEATESEIQTSLSASSNDHSIFQRASDEPKPIIEYNGWKGNSDSIASARFTWLTFSWLTNEQKTDTAAREIVATREDRAEAVSALKQYVEETIFGNNPNTSGLAHDLVQNTFQYEVNWSEIVNAFRD
jgi:hypothetical protein